MALPRLNRKFSLRIPPGGAPFLLAQERGERRRQRGGAAPPPLLWVSPPNAPQFRKPLPFTASSSKPSVPAKPCTASAFFAAARRFALQWNWNAGFLHCLGRFAFYCNLCCQFKRGKGADCHYIIALLHLNRGSMLLIPPGGASSVTVPILGRAFCRLPLWYGSSVS